ncbi:hypothetical protein [Nocardia neocaledoniensis]|uniref:pPIWI_RE_Z domain-containing protein n=1 Tax=Nocardia neocaledoniensis TaxID=236511 RepID=UPI002453FB6D|nr:hypothetical protein [Nocardia neocaledoniensis]
MRTRTDWRRDLVAELKSALGGSDPARLTQAITEVELTLVLLARVAPGESADAGWSLLNGYPVLEASGIEVGEADRKALAVARFRLTGVKGPYDFARAVALYEQVPIELRGFSIEAGRSFRRRDVTQVTRRWADYDDALSQAPKHNAKSLRTAKHGEYVLASARNRSSVRIPEWITFPEKAVGHDITPRVDRGSLTVTREQLLAAARQMDRAEADLDGEGSTDNWESRIGRIIFEIRGADDRFSAGVEFTVDGMLHVAGMLSVGKTTLVVVLAWHLTVVENMRVGVVLGDVTAVLRMVDLFNRLAGECHAAPVLGESNRQTHVERIHRFDARAGALPLYPQHSGYRWVSTACALDGLRLDSAVPWPIPQAPCRNLRPPADEDDETYWRRKPPLSCPMWGGCRRHDAARALVTARLWVATTASLVQTRVPEELNPEGMRYLEAAWRTMDLIIVDEADQVQAQLDALFSPSQMLIGDTESWLLELWGQVDQTLGRSQLAPLQDSDVLDWVAHLNLVRIATTLLYSLLIGKSGRYLRGWMGEDYFTGWTIASKLGEDWGQRLHGDVAPGQSLLASNSAEELREAFDAFLDDPLGRRPEILKNPAATALVDLVKTLHLPDAVARHNEFAQWIRRVPMTPAQSQSASNPTRKRTDTAEPPADSEAAEVLQLQLLVITTVLANQLDAVIERWRGVEGRLDLRRVSPLMFHRPPPDFTPVIPDSPMGNVLGFRYRDNDRRSRPYDDDDSEPGGQLSFFRYAGVGRYVLLQLHDLFRADGVRGPNVMLMSGTSWAGNSPRYHIDHRVDVVLRAPSKEIDAINESRFFTLPLYPPDQPDQPYVVSGVSDRESRRRNLAGMARALAAPRLGTSRLESALARVEPSRQRALILVGSYDEACLVADTIAKANDSLRHRVRYLVADDRDFGADWLAPSGAAPLARGDVESLYSTDAVVLVAPLLAMERGHNILTDDHRAAIGAAFFFVRPHPRPDDLDYVTQTMNAWAISQINNKLPVVPPQEPTGLGERARYFRHKAQGLWRSWLRRQLSYGALRGPDKDGMTWSQLVGIWQVIGRLVRGGCPAEVYFCDAKFAPTRMGLRSTEDDTDISLIFGMASVLSRYINAPTSDPDAHLVTLLYEPLHRALSNLEGAPL